jgi:hypothetical protein
MITEELKELVKIEAENLLLHATPSELQRLDITTLQPEFEKHCVYGQMTGECFNERSLELIVKCCKKGYRDLYLDGNLMDIDAGEIKDPFDRYDHFFSPIEYYICREGAKNANLIAYLKGEINTLNL